MVSRISSSSFMGNASTAMIERQAEINKVMGQLGTGLKFNSAADNPLGSTRLFQLKQHKAALDTYNKNTGLANSEYAKVDDRLRQASTVLTAAKQHVIALNSGTLNANDVYTYATQLESALSELTDIANTRIDGRYLFSGVREDQVPVYKDLNGNFNYMGDETIKNAFISDDVTIRLNDTAKDIFFQLPTKNISLSGYSGATSITATNPGLIATGQLDVLHSLGNNGLKINGMDVIASNAASDNISSTDNQASARSIVAAINATNNNHHVTAYYSNTTVDFINAAAATDDIFAAGDLVINGVSIVGDSSLEIGATPIDRVMSLINTFTATTRVTASINAGELRLTATDGSNMQISSVGGNPAALNLTGFNFAAGDNRVKRADVILVDHNPINLTTDTFIANANSVGFVAGDYTIAANTGTVTMSTPIIRKTPAAEINVNETYQVRFVSPTEYQVFRESDPVTPVTDFLVYAANTTFELGSATTTTPAVYTSGDKIVIDGIEIVLEGAPVAGDTFYIRKEKQAHSDIFTSLRNVINDAKNYKGQNSRFSYHMGLALGNIESAEENISNMLGVVGARMNRVENQENSNTKFDEMCQQSISEIVDLNWPEAITGFTQLLTILSALQSATARTQGLTIFNNTSAFG